ncbi:MAG: DegT/DnrJ/EryC1/StrS aminotransferase family protein [Proteobacteria bacterium]|nr:MAG: DegT/DnrJ/EryC1/StrS aminotransferase family protein [Pseudomonadota bacterium]
MSKTFIPVSRPVMIGNEAKYVMNALQTGWISSAGEYITSFESKFAQWVHADHGVACSNGTASVYLALRAAGVGSGDRVVVPTFTMMASIFPIVMLGAIPVFVDCEADTWNIDTQLLQNIDGRVKAIMVVHIYGHPVDMDPVHAFARSKNAVVIEDAAEAHGALYKGKPTGALSDIAAWSFYSNKVITTGEGGMVTTNSSSYAERSKYYRNLCFDPNPDKRFIHEEIGFNYRMTNLQAAIGLGQMENADRLVEMRRSMASKYLERLSGLTDYIQLPVEKEWAKNVYWMFGLVLRDSVKADAPEIMKRLATRGVDTRRFFCPAHIQPCLAEFSDNVKAPRSEHLWQKGLYLPSSADLTENEADIVAEELRAVLSGVGCD